MEGSYEQEGGLSAIKMVSYTECMLGTHGVNMRCGIDEVLD